MLCGAERMAISLLIKLSLRSGSMRVEFIKDNDEGSANFTFDLTSEEAESLLCFGILEALKAGLREGEKLKVEGKDV